MRRENALPALAGLGLGALILGPALRPGFVLSYDMVFVPDPPATAAMFGRTGGFPRQVPSDAVAAALSWVLPWSQQLILLTIFVLAAWGMARLVPGGLIAKLGAAAFYVWNPYVAERLLLGQWALLLGYAGLPWVLAATAGVKEKRGSLRMAAALLPAAIGGFAAMNLTALVVFGVLAARRGQGAARAILVFAVMALPWLIPALTADSASTDPAGVDLFHARADTPFGTLGSLVSLGGIWNAQTVPGAFGSWPTATARLLLALLCLASGLRFRPAAIAGLTGLALACIGITEPSRAVLHDLVGFWPGFGVLRDGQLYVGPLALLEAFGFGLLLAALSKEFRLPAVLVPLLVLPTFGWGVGGQLRSVHYPADWLKAQQIINADPQPGKALSLPWGAYRRYSWNHDRAVLDPLPRMLKRRTVWNDGLMVGDRALAQEDPLAIRADGLIRTPGPLAGPFADAGYRYVVISKDVQENSWRERFAGAKPVLDGPSLLVFALDHPG